MKFDVALNQGLIKETIPGLVEKTKFCFPCDACKTLTYWYKLNTEWPDVPCCSDECLIELQDREASIVRQRSDKTIHTDGNQGSNTAGLPLTRSTDAPI
jgi:hypothetical protein